MAEGNEPEAVESVVVNVKDFGAVGDGKTDDRSAIIDAFWFALTEYMVNSIPVTVYFPEGQYGLLNGGMYIYLPRGYGNLTVKGDGADKSTIVYLDEWNNSGSWVALRIGPKVTPESEEEYLHDITIQDLGVYDTDPVNHAWSTDKGDPGTEETHGFNIQYCVRATIKNCVVTNVGDEALDMTHCIDSEMVNNYVENSPGAGSAGGAISVGDGCDNVLVANNTVVATINDSAKINWAVAVEALAEPVTNITIRDNDIRDIAGWAVNIGAPAGSIANVTVENNTIYHCRDGGIRFMGTGETTNVQLINNEITRVGSGVLVDGKNKSKVTIDGCVIENVTNYGVAVQSPTHSDTVIRNTIIRDAKWRAIYNAGVDTVMDGLFVDGSGTRGGVTDSAIVQYAKGGNAAIYNSVLLNCQNKKAIQDVHTVVNTYVDQTDTSGFSSITGATLIQNCRVNRLASIKAGGTIDGLVLYTTADLGTHAITLSGVTDCTIKNSVFIMPSRYAVYETGEANNNTILNNICVGGSGVKTIGADSVSDGNVRTALAETEQFTYRIVDGAATVIAVKDKAVTDATIPATLEGCPVTAIDPWAFALCQRLVSVSVPDSVVTVSDSAFAYCSALTEVYYGGLESQRANVTVGVQNDAFIDAAWTYHWNNHSYDSCVDIDCDACGFVREALAHAYDDDVDVDCNECGATRELVTTLPGDANGDGDINNRDLALLQQYINGWEVTVDADAMDVNDDGDVNNRDLALLQQYINGWDVELH